MSLTAADSYLFHKFPLTLDLAYLVLTRLNSNLRTRSGMRISGPSGVLSYTEAFLFTLCLETFGRTEIEINEKII